MTLQERVTPEELDAWLRSTVVIGTENEDYPDEPSSCEVEPDHPLNKRKKGLLRRSSSSDKADFSSQSCFGVDAAVLLANEAQKGVQEEDNNFAQLNPYFMLPSEGSNTVDIKNYSRGIRDCHGGVLTAKKRRVSSPTSPGDLPYHCQTSQVAQPPCPDTETPYCRLVTDDSVSLDHEAQYIHPFHTIDNDAGYSLCSSLYTVPPDNPPDRGVHSFLQAMEVSQRSHNMLFDLKFSMSIGGSLKAMKESGMSRTILFKMSRRTAVRNMTSASVIKGQCGSASLGRKKQYDQELVAAGLRRIVRDEMLRSNQGQEFTRHSLGF